MSKTFTFSVELQGTGESEDHAWVDALEGFVADPGFPAATEPEKKEIPPEDFGSGPYLVLSDGQTFSPTKRSFVCYLNEEGDAKLKVTEDMSEVLEENMLTVSINDLLDAYNKVHGTRY